MTTYCTAIVKSLQNCVNVLKMKRLLHKGQKLPPLVFLKEYAQLYINCVKFLREVSTFDDLLITLK